MSATADRDLAITRRASPNLAETTTTRRCHPGNNHADPGEDRDGAVDRDLTADSLAKAGHPAPAPARKVQDKVTTGDRNPAADPKDRDRERDQDRVKAKVGTRAQAPAHTDRDKVRAGDRGEVLA